SDIGTDTVGGHEPFQPFAVGGDATTLSVRALKEQSDAGCAGAMVASAVPSIPDALSGAVVGFQFTSWDVPMVGSVDLASSPLVSAVLDGEGEGPDVAAHSVHVFDSAFQLHGTLRESAFAVATLDEQAFVTAFSVLGMLPRRVRVARGSVVAFSKDKHWALAVPLERPATAKKARRLLFRGLRRIDVPYTEIHENHLRISPLQGPPLLVGLTDGMVFASTRDDVVMDAIVGAGSPWIEPAAGPYGLRLRVSGMGHIELFADEELYRFSFTADDPVSEPHE
ncbi:MAG: hypothetical protein KC912_18875, partial [Proteobacteria bacterium]|nr:hypothetical protein [Pseudomonadota bacterium]